MVDELGYTEPSPIQAEAIAPLVEGRDLLGQAATGTGKTAAFALPMLERLAELRPGRAAATRPFGLILAPTRELALQVSEAVTRYGAAAGRPRASPCTAGRPSARSGRRCSDGVDVVVATPGRAIDLMNRGALRLDELEIVVLDEADEMLDMGFVEDIETLLDATPDTRQAVLFSATDAAPHRDLAQNYLREPVTVRIARARSCRGRGAAGAPDRVPGAAHAHHRRAGPGAGGRAARQAAIVFCRTRLDVDAVTETLTARGLRAEALHGGMDQEHRTRVVERLRSGRTELLVATDVAARGLDIDLLTHVVNHDVPQSPEAYVHRIGRVGRAGREGVAITLVPPSKVHALRAVERLTGQPIEIAPVPTAADLRAARLARTRDALLRAAGQPTTPDEAADGVATMIGSLAAEYDPVAVAAAAVRLLQDAAGAPDDGADIPVVTAPAAAAAREPRGRARAAAARGHPPAEGRHRPAVRQRRPRQRGAPAGHRGRAGQRVQPVRPRHRGHPDPRAARAGGDPRARGGRRPALPARQHHAEGPPGQHPPRPRLRPPAPRRAGRQDDRPARPEGPDATVRSISRRRYARVSTFGERGSRRARRIGLRADSRDPPSAATGVPHRADCRHAQPGAR